MEDGFTSHIIHHDKTEHSNKTQDSYTSPARSLLGKHFKADGDVRMCRLKKQKKEESKFEIYVAVAEGSLLASGLENGAIMTVCRQQ